MTFQNIEFIGHTEKFLCKVDGVPNECTKRSIILCNNIVFRILMCSIAMTIFSIELFTPNNVTLKCLLKFHLKTQNKELAFDNNMHPWMMGMHNYFRGMSTLQLKRT